MKNLPKLDPIDDLEIRVYIRASFVESVSRGKNAQNIKVTIVDYPDSSTILEDSNSLDKDDQGCVVSNF